MQPVFTYRDAYGELKLDEFQRGKQRVPVLALAATATHQLVQDLTDGLQMAAPQLIMALIDHGQHNLQYEVRRPGRQPCRNAYSITFVTVTQT